MVMCLERGADCLHMVQLMPLPSQNHITSFHIKSRLGLTFLVLACPGCLGVVVVVELFLHRTVLTSLVL